MNTGTRNYAIVTAACWDFTLAFLFLLYEAMGVAANLIGGGLATRYGIQRMLTSLTGAAAGRVLAGHLGAAGAPSTRS